MKAIKEIDNDLLVNIDVSPNGSKFEIIGYNTWRERIELRIKAIPQKGKANKEIIKEISSLVNSPVEIVQGLKSHQKTLRIQNISKDKFLKYIGLSEKL